MSLIQMEVEEYGWMSPQEFVDIVAVSQVTPGPIGINCATYVGYTATGSVWGAVLTTTAIILPSLIIMLSVCRAYFWIDKRFHDNPYFTQTLRMLRFTVIGLIAAAALMLVRPETFRGCGALHYSAGNGKKQDDRGSQSSYLIDRSCRRRRVPYLRLDLLQLGVGKEQGLGALGIEVNLNLIILRDLVPIDADDGAVAEDAVGDAVAGRI